MNPEDYNEDLPEAQDHPTGVFTEFIAVRHWSKSKVEQETPEPMTAEAIEEYVAAYYPGFELLGVR